MALATHTILVFQHLVANTIASLYQDLICMATNLLVRECTEHNVEMIHIGAHLEIMKHAEVSMLWTVLSWLKMQVSICCVESIGHFWSLYSQSHNVQSPSFTLLQITWCLGFLFWATLCLIWLRSDVDKLSSNRKQSSQGSTEATKGNVTLWVISARVMNSAQSRVALNSLINWLFKRKNVLSVC